MIEIKGIDPKMIANNIEPFEPTHPGELLRDEIECRHISQKQLAADMGVSYTVLNDTFVRGCVGYSGAYPSWPSVGL